MTAEPDPVQILEQRVAALEADRFDLLSELRRIDHLVQSSGHSIDDLEEVITDVVLNTAAGTDAIAAAMSTNPQAHPDADPTSQHDSGRDLDAHDADQGWSEQPPGQLVLAPYATTEDPYSTDDNGYRNDGQNGGNGGGQRRSQRPGGDGGADGGGVEPPPLPQLHAWVQDYIAPMVRKVTATGEGGGIRWCRDWWHHIDAVERFIALYMAFQELSTEENGTWLSVYLRDHLDPHLATLTSPIGPFYACSPRRHSDAFEPLGTAPLGPESFDLVPVVMTPVGEHDADDTTAPVTSADVPGGTRW